MAGMDGWQAWMCMTAERTRLVTVIVWRYGRFWYQDEKKATNGHDNENQALYVCSKFNMSIGEFSTSSSSSSFKCPSSPIQAVRFLLISLSLSSQLMSPRWSWKEWKESGLAVSKSQKYAQLLQINLHNVCAARWLFSSVPFLRGLQRKKGPLNPSSHT